MIVAVAETAFRPPFRLDGRYIRLEPLQDVHARQLAVAGREPRIWQFMVVPPATDEASMSELIQELLRREASGTDLAFTIMRLPEERPIGMTRYLNIERPSREVEIGGTWLDPSCWRTPANTEMKMLLLRHAFEVERFHRVQLKTDLQRALAARDRTVGRLARGSSTQAYAPPVREVPDVRALQYSRGRVAGGPRSARIVTAAALGAD